MTERRGARTGGDAVDQAEVQAQVEAAADELYGLPPDEFSPARDDLIRQAREQRNQPLARELAKLRKPTQSAWLINLLWRDQHEVIEQLFELASELGQAQAAAAGSALRELTQQRRQLETALLRRAVDLAAQAGVRVSDSVAREAQETLGAALALPEVADEVRSGRLVKPATYAGFGGAATAGAARPSAQPARRAPIDLQEVQRRRAAEAATTPDPRRGAQGEAAETERQADEAETERERQADEADAAASQAEEQARRAEAERIAAEERKRQLEAAQQALGAAEAELRSATRAAEAAAQRHADLRTRLDAVREQLQRLETDVERAERAASEADAAQQQAQAAHAEAEAALTRAQDPS